MGNGENDTYAHEQSTGITISYESITLIILNKSFSVWQRKVWKFQIILSQGI
jgi:hypothetical protein